MGVRPSGSDTITATVNRRARGVRPGGSDTTAYDPRSVLARIERVSAAAGLAGGLLQLVAELVALLVDGGDHRAGGQAEADERRLRELQAGLDGLRHRVGDADRVEVAGMRGIAGARDDQHIGPQRAHDAARSRRSPPASWMVTITAARVHQSAALQEGEAWRRRRSRPARPRRRYSRDGGRIAVGGDEREAVPLQHVAHDLPDAAMADDDGVPAARRPAARPSAPARAPLRRSEPLGDAARGERPAAGSAPWSARSRPA